MEALNNEDNKERNFSLVTLYNKQHKKPEILNLNKNSKWLISSPNNILNNNYKNIYSFKGGKWYIFDENSYIWGFHSYVNLKDEVHFDKLGNNEYGLFKYKDSMKIKKYLEEYEEQAKEEAEEDGEKYEKDMAQMESNFLHDIAAAGNGKINKGYWISKLEDKQYEIYTRTNKKGNLVAFAII